jgi:subtilase family serine protease
MYGLNIDPFNPGGNPSPIELQQLGVQTVRFTFKDDSAGDHPDPDRVKFYRDKVQAYSEVGIRSLIILTNETYPGFPNTFPASDAAWHTYIRPYARRAGQLAQIFEAWQPILQVWNEPDLQPSPGYTPSMSEQQYAHMLERTYSTIKAINSSLVVITAGLASGSPAWLNTVIQALGGELRADAVALHPYGQRPEPDWPTPDYGVGYVGDFLNGYLQVTSLPLTITEVGERHLSLEGQAEFLRRFYSTVITDFSEEVHDIHWFCYSDNMVSGYGLLTEHGQRKPAYFSYRDIATQPSAVLADTIVSDVRPNQTSIIENSQVTFEAMVKNIGGSITADIVGVAFLVDGNYITYGTTTPIGAGESRLIRSVSTWTATPGEHTLIAVVDDVNRYPEASENNNSLQKTFRVRPSSPPSLSDVVVEDIAFERDETDRVRLAALIANKGESQTGDIVGVAFFVDDQYVTFGTTPPIPAGDSQVVSAIQTLNLTGSHKITAFVDDVNRFPEENEENNIRTEHIDFGGLQPSLADAIVAAITIGNGRIIEGDQVTFEALIRNIGSAQTNDIVGVAFLVDGQYITFGTTEAIPAGESRLVPAISTWQATAGSHRVTAVVDDINRFPELSETNNQLEQLFEVFVPDQVNLPDSMVSDIGFETEASGKILLTATVSNIGTLATPDLVGVAFFVDGQYRTYGITQSMAPNTVKVIHAVEPLSLQGKHTIMAIVDDVNRYDEISHQNNVLVRELTFG